MSKKVTRIEKEEILFIDSVKIFSDDNKAYAEKLKDISCEWKFSFTLCTRRRKFYLFVISEEELFLWMSAFYRILGVSVNEGSYEIPKAIAELYHPSKTGCNILRLRDSDPLLKQSLVKSIEERNSE